jgi:hypothetical protein
LFVVDITANRSKNWKYKAANWSKTWKYRAANWSRTWKYTASNRRKLEVYSSHSEKNWKYKAANWSKTWKYRAANWNRTWKYTAANRRKVGSIELQTAHSLHVAGTIGIDSHALCSTVQHTLRGLRHCTPILHVVRSDRYLLLMSVSS